MYLSIFIITIRLNNYLKYLLSLFLVLALIANEGALNSQTKAADYYQSSYVINKEESNFKSFHSFHFGQFNSLVRISFFIPVIYLHFKEICTFRIRVALKTHLLLYQNINSFIKKSVFINQIITSTTYTKSLYNA